MALQNIGDEDDAFYRYKMPRMITKVEGRGNGIKTNVVNMVDIAKALSRPASYTTKYFGCELGAQSKFDKKTGNSHVNGSHETSILAGLLGNFIKKYVKCYKCGNPETEIVITKTQMILLKCIACGYLSDVDMRDKLTTFIVKNPPDRKEAKSKKAMRKAEKERIKEGENIDEEQKKRKKEAAKKKSTSSPNSKAVKGNNPNDDENDVQWQTDTSAEAARLRIQEQLSSVTAGMLMLSIDEENHPNNNVEEIKEYLKKGGNSKNLKNFMSTLSGTPQERMNALFEALFDGIGKGFSKEAIKKKDYLGCFAKDEGFQLCLLEALEGFCGNARVEAVKEVALVIKGLYDADLLEEESIMEWYNKGSSGDSKGMMVWKYVKPFVEWLQSAESETEDK